MNLGSFCKITFFAPPGEMDRGKVHEFTFTPRHPHSAFHTLSIPRRINKVGFGRTLFFSARPLNSLNSRGRCQTALPNSVAKKN